jgi:hypothetical protein
VETALIVKELGAVLEGEGQADRDIYDLVPQPCPAVDFDIRKSRTGC